MNPKFVPTPEQAELEREVERQKKRLAEQGHALAMEQADSAVPTGPEPISIAEAVAPAVDVFARLQARMEAFYAEMRPKLAAEKQSVPCTAHRTRRPIDFDGSCSATKAADKFTVVYAECADCAAEKKGAKNRTYWRVRGVEERNIESSFANFRTGTEEKAQTLGAVRAWSAARHGFLLLTGPTGTGKGHLATACLRHHGSGIFIKHPDLLADLRKSYTLHDTERVLTRWQDAEMLVLDEFGLSPGGKDEEPFLYQVLADRYDKRRPTIITSNLDRPKMREALGFRLLDRIREDCTECVLDWKSHRTSK